MTWVDCDDWDGGSAPKIRRGQAPPERQFDPNSDPQDSAAGSSPGAPAGRLSASRHPGKMVASTSFPDHSGTEPVVLGRNAVLSGTGIASGATPRGSANLDCVWKILVSCQSWLDGLGFESRIAADAVWRRLEPRTPQADGSDAFAPEARGIATRVRRSDACGVAGWLQHVRRVRQRQRAGAIDRPNGDKLKRCWRRCGQTRNDLHACRAAAGGVRAGRGSAEYIL